ATSDLSHLAAACMETTGTTLDEVVAAVARLEAAGELVPPAQRAAAGGDEEDDADGAEAAAQTDAPQPATDSEPAPAEAAADASGGSAVDPEQVMALLRGRIDRLGPVNMMAIEQFDELESRHAFLTAQRRDLVDSIAQTGEAIKKIDKTTRERFAEAFES